MKTDSLRECLEQLNAQQAQADAIAERMAEIDRQIAVLAAERDGLFLAWEDLVGEPLEVVGELLSPELIRHEADEKRGIFRLKGGSRILRGTGGSCCRTWKATRRLGARWVPGAPQGYPSDRAKFS